MLIFKVFVFAISLANGLRSVPIAFIFFKFVYSGIISLILFPYAVILGLMAMVSTLVIFHDQCKLLFRILVSIGAYVFVLSDTIFGILIKTQDMKYALFINPTYILAVFLLLFSTLILVEVDKKII